ncbi:Ubiquitin carboxyl-terminal hydrolase 1 [Nakaseomyces bracarensis]|uniref:Ubiquitin carboxyl-terminal hydrolase n=1 Tax=Nakaseomyces bracarensis TaxID=273131 RepID=A0ABR4NM87_9SACH
MLTGDKSLENSSTVQNLLSSKLVAIALVFATYYLFVDSSTRYGIWLRMGDFLRNSRDGIVRRFAPNSGYYSIDDQVLKRGGYVAGLLNDGNFCFMNSVIQSLASSKELLQFLEDEIIARYDALESENNETEEKEIEEEDSTKKQKTSGKTYGKSKKKTNRKIEDEKHNNEPNVEFSVAFKALLDKLNQKHYKDKPYFKTNSMLRTMSNSPQKNMLQAYDQEDAQEFFQTILSELEKNVKSLDGEKNEQKPVSEEDLPEEPMIGQAHLGKMGTVYIPTEQIDPNSLLDKPSSKYFTPFKLVTPLDGLTAERIGCLNCGENGGIRYSIFSSLSLNLPSENIGANLKLSSLFNEWIKPEIIEGVDCNRCALEAVKEHLLSQLKSLESKENTPDKLLEAVKSRLSELEKTLQKSVIDDEDYKKLHTENMVRKCSKSKQVVISRPPPLLSIHINRSVFDPRTYMIRKNNSRVLFKSRMNLEPWCCDIDEINLDARLPMSKKQKQVESSEDENIGGEYYTKLHQKFEKAFDDSDEDMEEDDSDDYEYRNRNVAEYDPLNGELGSDISSEESESEEEVDALGNSIPKEKTVVVKEDKPDPEDDDEEDDEEEDADYKEELEPIADSEEDSEREESVQAPPINLAPRYSTVNPSPLTYALRSVIVHYGTHNYGHYIAYRKYRGVWWRISDESVYVVDEAEVLSTPGVFMLFYEYDYDEKTGRMKDDLEYEFQTQTYMNEEEQKEDKNLEQEDINSSTNNDREATENKENNNVASESTA